MKKADGRFEKRRLKKELVKTKKLPAKDLNLFNTPGEKDKRFNAIRPKIEENMGGLCNQTKEFMEKIIGENNK